MTSPEAALDTAQPSRLHLLAPVAALLFVGGVVASGADSQTIWYVIRGTGVIAYLLLAASMVVGLLITNRALPAGRPRVDLYEVHTFVSLLAIAFTGVHGLALLLDEFIGFSPLQIIVPFTSDYRPLAVGFGIVGLYLLVAVYASFWARKQIGYKTWRALHFATFGAFTLGALHGAFSGTDSGTWWMLVIYGGSVAAIGALIGRRVLTSRSPARGASRVA